MDLLEKTKQFFANDLYAKLSGIEIVDAKEGYALCTMKIREDHQNTSGFVMGGAIYTLADFAAGVASNCGRPVTVTSSAQINFLRAAKCTELRAEAYVIREGTRTNYTEVGITDEHGTLIARSSANGYRP